MPNEYVLRTRCEQNKQFLQHHLKKNTLKANLIYKRLFLEGNADYFHLQ